jgi:hypothetical protein
MAVVVWLAIYPTITLLNGSTHEISVSNINEYHYGNYTGTTIS